MQTAPTTRVDIYAAHGDADSPLGAWLACGSLIGPRLVVPHLPLPERTGLAVLCAISADGTGDAVHGVTLESADGSPATGVALDRPTVQPVQRTPVAPDLEAGESLTTWLEVIAGSSGCSHRAPGGVDTPQPPLESWWCRIWRTAPGC
jgi:hypothetical protein